MDRLWTPWRFEYIRGISESEECVFCRILSQHRDSENLVLWRGRHAFIILNLFPYTSGHLLIVANRHISFLSEASAEELHAIFDSAQRCEQALASEYKPDGFNLGFNLGKAAGAGVAHHLHMHLLPRWAGDSNFVSIVGETRVLPEELPRSYSRLLPYFQRIQEAGATAGCPPPDRH
jgi:ATP adenylyltransferase